MAKSYIKHPRSMWQVRREEKARPKVHEWKGAFWIVLGLFALLALLVWSLSQNVMNHRYVQLGKSVDCVERPSYEYFNFCNAKVDGAACTFASQSRMMQFYEPIDYACAQYEPQRPFIFPVNNEPETLEVAEING